MIFLLPSFIIGVTVMSIIFLGVMNLIQLATCDGDIINKINYKIHSMEDDNVSWHFYH